MIPLSGISAVTSWQALPSLFQLRKLERSFGYTVTDSQTHTHVLQTQNSLKKVTASCESHRERGMGRG